MSRFRKLTETEKATLLTGANLRACDCGTNDWTVEDDAYFVSPDSVRVNNPDIVRRAPAPFAVVSCPNCSRVVFFKAPAPTGS